jgi:predicted Zn-ribbon and HTH transcriptional regulator
MLTQLIELLENKENGLSLSEISRAMKAQPSAVLSMIDLLVQKGKLLEIGPDGKRCSACGLQSDCNLLVARGKRYMVKTSQADEVPASPCPLADSALETYPSPKADSGKTV